MTADGIGVAGDYGSLATYADAAHYDRRYRLRKQDVAWYVARAAALGGPILECGVGSGRIALALARAGHDVVGVDLSAPMLTRLTQRLQQESATIRARLQVDRKSVV